MASFYRRREPQLKKKKKKSLGVATCPVWKWEKTITDELVAGTLIDRQDSPYLYFTIQDGGEVLKGTGKKGTLYYTGRQTRTTENGC